MMTHEQHQDERESARACGCPACRAKYGLPAPTVSTAETVGAAILGLGALVIGGLVVTRAIKKQTLAAQLRQAEPTMGYVSSVIAAHQALGYDNHPLRP